VYDLGFVVIVALTSLAAWLVRARGPGLSRSRLGAAARATLETVGLAVLFLAANLTLAALVIALARAVTGRFVSVYGIDDLAFGAVSLLQGIAFRWWVRERG
jgi:hypothetical protein